MKAKFSPIQPEDLVTRSVEKRRGKFPRFSLTYILVGLLLVGLLASIKLYLDTQTKLKQMESQANTGVVTLTDEEVKLLISNVSRHIVLPAEVPQVVTITDVNKLRGQQPFFAKAKNGDKLLVYKDRVILYNPTLDKIIDIAQIRGGEEGMASPAAILVEPAASPTSTPLSTPTPAQPDSEAPLE